MKLILVRHCETDANRNGIWEGSGNSKLSYNGISQAKILADNLKSLQIHTVYCSPKLRCIQTLEYIKAQNKYIDTVEYIDSLSEINFGDWENRDYKYISENYPNLWNEFLKDYENFIFPNGESFKHFYSRCIKALKYILSKNVDCITVTHEGVIKCMLSYIDVQSSKMFRDIHIYHGNYINVEI